MITLNITVDDISTVIQVYDRIRYARATSDTGTFTTVSGLGPTILVAGVSSYSEIDDDGTSTNWYKSQYYSTSTSNESSWSDPVLGDAGDLFYNPLFPTELNLGTAQQLVVDRIRTLVGDPIGLRRDYGEEAASSIHFDNKTYELEQKGWPASVHMGGTAYNTSTNPTINGYKYLRFSSDISVTTVTSGIEYGVDIWYYTFRWSDRQILETYDNTPPPVPLSAANTSSEVFMLACAYDLLSNETWEDNIEDGAVVKDEGSHYDPSPGLKQREEMLKRLKKRLDDAIKASTFLANTGVLID
jgi:hypothetical protein